MNYSTKKEHFQKDYSVKIFNPQPLMRVGRKAVSKPKRQVTPSKTARIFPTISFEIEECLSSMYSHFLKKCPLELELYCLIRALLLRLKANIERQTARQYLNEKKEEHSKQEERVHHSQHTHPSKLRPKVTKISNKENTSTGSKQMSQLKKVKMKSFHYQQQCQRKQIKQKQEFIDAERLALLQSTSIQLQKQDSQKTGIIKTLQLKLKNQQQLRNQSEEEVTKIIKEKQQLEKDFKELALKNNQELLLEQQLRQRERELISIWQVHLTL